jgi:hypothetical protein
LYQSICKREAFVRRIIVPFFFALLIASSPNAQAQPPMQDPAMTAAGPEFCPRGPCPGSEQVAALQRSLSQKAPKPEAAPKPALFPPNPYQMGRAALQEAADAAAVASQQHSPSLIDLSGGHGFDASKQRPNRDGYVPAGPGYSSALEEQSRAIFPHDEERRLLWMAEQEQQAIANDINRTKPLIYPVSGR